VASSSSSSSSEEETDDESVGNYGSAFSSEDYDYDIEDESTDSEDQHTNEVLDNLIWRFTPYHHTDERLRLAAHKKSIYSHQTELKTGVGGSFKTPLGALQVVGGFDFDTVKRLCRNSNEYIKMCVLPSRTNQLLYGIRFEDITLSEMIKFFGIMLRMSLIPIDYGGYPAYFSRSDADIVLDNEQTITASGTKGWASEIMDLRRFKIIRKAFHPEDRIARACGDKCYQIRHLLRKFKAFAKSSFIPGRDISFDEGGIGSRHRLNPVRMYNAKNLRSFVSIFLFAVSQRKIII